METTSKKETAAASHVTGDWLFKKGGQVFGPVPARRLLELLYRGEIGGETLVATENGTYRPLGQIPAFVVHAKKAEATLRVEREVTGARQLEKRRSRLRTSVSIVLGLLTLGFGSYGAYWLATNKPWQKRSALLEDFGNGIALVSAAQVGQGNRFGDVEVDIPLGPGEGGRGKRPPKAVGKPGTPSSSSGSGQASVGEDGETIMAQYDKGDIERTIAREQRSLAPCLLSEAQRSPNFSGVVPVEFAIGNDGRVVQLWIDEPRFKRGALYDCMLRTLKGWRFRPFPGQRPTVGLSFRISAR